MANETKKVVLRWEVDGGGNVARELSKIGEGAKDAGQSVNKLAQELVKAGKLPGVTPSGGGAGVLFGAAGTRDQLVLEAMRHANYKNSGLTPKDLLAMSDEQLVGLRGQLANPPKPAAPSTLLGRVGGELRGAGQTLWEKTGLSGLKTGGGVLAVAASALAANEGINSAGLVRYQGGTPGEQLRAYANSNLVTRTGLGLLDSVRGRTQQFGKADYDAKLAEIRREGTEQSRLEQNQLLRERLEYRSRAEALNADRRYASVGAFDRGTVAGERLYRESLATVGAKQGVIDAEKDADAVKRVQAGQERERMQLRGRLQGLILDSGDLYQKAQAAGGVDKYVGSAAENRKLADIKSALNELKDLERQIEQTRERAVQAGAQVGQARIGVMQAQLGVLEGREQTAAGQDRMLGRMNRVQFMNARRAAEMVEAYGIDNVPPQVLDAARPLIGQHIDKLEEKRGGQYRADNMDLLGRFDQYQNADTADLRRQVEQLRKIIEGMEEALKRGVADDAAAKLRGEENIKNVIKIVGDVNRIEQRAAKNAAEMNNTKGQ